MDDHSRRASILIVEDDESIRELLGRVLRQDGYHITEAANGAEALLLIAEATPNLIISDVMMPDLDGLGMLARLRADPATRAIPLMLLTAVRGTKALTNGLDLGADDYIVKPFNIDELLARVRAKLARPPIPADLLPHDRQTGLLTTRAFRQEVAREFARARRGGAPGVLAYLDLVELPQLHERLGVRSEAQLAKQLASLAGADAHALDTIGHAGAGRLALLLPETDEVAAQRRLAELARRIAGHVFSAGGERIRLTPAIGYTAFNAATSADALHKQSITALSFAAAHLDLQPMRYTAEQDALHRSAAHAGGWVARWAYLSAELRLPAQLALVVLFSFAMPFAVYRRLATDGLDVTPVAYIIVVLALLITACLIWIEGFMALDPVEPPAQAATPYPPASAIIAAYLPNEAATVIETIESFLRQEYPGQFQIILAYNTPRDLPIEALLGEIARRDDRFLPVRVAGSTSKAQNVNAALTHISGEFIGVFDADHHPAPDSFARAWRWLSHGYDIVQGHCLVRNGGESWVARVVAVEFEAIYAVSHPGRARLHNFGIFGGSNGYWKAELLRQTRMHGFMLTEDIDMSIRAIEAGYAIASDPGLISRELATTTLKAFWNQRMRWAQGWFQVSLKHIWRGMWSPHLSGRQKLGLVHLLAWREIYPWIAFQILPIIAFWAWRYGGLDRIDWFVPLFVLTTLFTQSVALGQALFAYRLAAPDIRRQRGWFIYFFFISFCLFTPLKNLIAMVAQIKEVCASGSGKSPHAAPADTVDTWLPQRRASLAGDSVGQPQPYSCDTPGTGAPRSRLARLYARRLRASTRMLGGWVSDRARGRRRAGNHAGAVQPWGGRHGAERPRGSTITLGDMLDILSCVGRQGVHRCEFAHVGPARAVAGLRRGSSCVLFGEPGAESRVGQYVGRRRRYDQSGARGAASGRLGARGAADQRKSHPFALPRRHVGYPRMPGGIGGGCRRDKAASSRGAAVWRRRSAAQRYRRPTGAD